MTISTLFSASEEMARLGIREVCLQNETGAALSLNCIAEVIEQTDEIRLSITTHRTISPPFQKLFKTQ